MGSHRNYRRESHLSRPSRGVSDFPQLLGGEQYEKLTRATSILAMSLSHSLVNDRCSSIATFYQSTDETVPRDWAQKAVARIADFPHSQNVGQVDGKGLVSVMKACFGFGPNFTE